MASSRVQGDDGYYYGDDDEHDGDDDGADGEQNHIDIESRAAAQALELASSNYGDAGSPLLPPSTSSPKNRHVSPFSSLSRRRVALRRGSGMAHRFGQQLGFGLGRWGVGSGSGSGSRGSTGGAEEEIKEKATSSSLSVLLKPPSSAPAKHQQQHQQQVQHQQHQRLVGKLHESKNVTASIGGSDRKGNPPLKETSQKGKGARRHTSSNNNNNNNNDNRRHRDAGEDDKFPEISTIAIARRKKRRSSTEAAATTTMTTTMTAAQQFHRRHSLPGTNTAATATATATTMSSTSKREATGSKHREATTGSSSSRRNHRKHQQPQQQQQYHRSSYAPVHRPSTMRTISGLGMEDPVAGIIAASQARTVAAAANANATRPTSLSEHPSLSRQHPASNRRLSSDSGLYGDHPSMIFDDMSFGAVPHDMQDMVTVASDPTADTRRGIDFHTFAACLPNFDPDAFSRAPPIPVFVSRRPRRPPTTTTKPSSTGDGCGVPWPTPALERQTSSDAMSLSLEDLQRSRGGSVKNASGAHASGDTLFTSASPASYPPPTTRASYVASFGSPSSSSSPRQRRSSLDQALARRRHSSSMMMNSFETSWTGNTRASALSSASIGSMNTNQVVAEAAWALQHREQQPHHARNHHSDSKIAAVSKELIEGALAAVSFSTMAAAPAPTSPRGPHSPASSPSQRRSPRFYSASPSGQSSRLPWTSRRHSSDSEFRYCWAGDTAEAADSRPLTATTTSASSVDDDNNNFEMAGVEEQRRRLLSSLLRAAPLPIQEEEDATHDVDPSESSMPCDGDAISASARAGRSRGTTQAPNDDASYGGFAHDDDDDDMTDLILLRVPSDEGEEIERSHFVRASSSRSSVGGDQSDEGSGETIEVVVMAVDEYEDEDDEDGEKRHLATAVSSSTASCDSVQARQLKEHLIALFVSGHASESFKSDKMEMILSPQSPQSQRSSASNAQASPPFSRLKSALSARSLSSNLGSPTPPYPTFVVASPLEGVEPIGKPEGPARTTPITKPPSFKLRRLCGNSSRSSFQYPEAHPLSPLPMLDQKLSEGRSPLASLSSASDRNHVTTGRRRSSIGTASDRSFYAPALTGTTCSVSTLRSAGSSSPAARREPPRLHLDRSPDSIMGERRTMPVSPASLFPEL
jgi:hypothetical protein